MSKRFNILYIYTRLYELLYDRKYLWTKFLTPLRVLIRYTGNVILPYYLKKSKLRINNTDNRVVVSLTSFPTRIDTVWMTISSLLRQTVVPYKILLWLSEEQFEGYENLPENLLNMQNDIFEIRFVSGDIRSHKKYYYVFSEYKEKLVITADDDIIYIPDMVERLLKVHSQNPLDVLCCFGVKMRYSDDGSLLPYNQWLVIPNKQNKSDIVFFGSGGGTLFRPNMLRSEILAKDKFLELAPTADDVWLNAMVRSSKICVKKIEFGQYFPIIKRNDSKLFHINVGKDQNDIQIEKVCDYLHKIDGRRPF